MRNLIVIPTDEMGGAEQMLKNIARAWLRQGKKMGILCLTSKKTGGWGDLRKHIVYLNTDSVYTGLLKMSFFFKGKKFETILSSQVYINGTLGFLRKTGILKTRFLILRESTSIFLRFKGYKKQGYKQFYSGYSRADLVIFQTELMKKQLEENVAKAKKWKKAVLENPVDMEHVRSKSIEPCEIFIKGKFIIGVGRLIPQKGFDVLIKAFEKIAPKFPQYNLLILGEGKERAKLENLISKTGLKDSVQLPGFVPNPFPYMKQAEVCVVSSRIEGFPNTLLQMLALNPKVITTRCAGGVEDFPYVEIIDPDEEYALSISLKKMLTSEGVGEKKRKEFLLEKSVENYLDKIEQLLI